MHRSFSVTITCPKTSPSTATMWLIPMNCYAKESFYFCNGCANSNNSDICHDCIASTTKKYGGLRKDPNQSLIEEILGDAPHSK